MLSHQLKQFEIDGEKSIIQNPNEVQRKEHEKSTFELHEVYAIDVLVSTGEGVVSSNFFASSFLVQVLIAILICNCRVVRWKQGPLFSRGQMKHTC